MSHEELLSAWELLKPFPYFFIVQRNGLNYTIRFCIKKRVINLASYFEEVLPMINKLKKIREKIECQNVSVEDRRELQKGQAESKSLINYTERPLMI